MCCSKVYVNDESGEIGKEAVVTCLKVPFQLFYFDGRGLIIGRFPLQGITSYV